MPVASYVFPNTDVDDMGKIGKELYSRKKLENNLYLIKKKKRNKNGIGDQEKVIIPFLNCG